MQLKILLLVLLFLLSNAIYAKNRPVISYPFSACNDSSIVKQNSIPIASLKLTAAQSCYDINWATWNGAVGATTAGNDATATITDADGSLLSVSMHANYVFGYTSSIYNYNKFSGYPSAIPNSLVPRTDWSAGAGGSTTMSFNKTVTNPVLLLSSLGSTLPQSARLDFSLPYVVLYDGGGMVYNSSTAITGTEGYAIIMFPGSFNSVTINSSTPETYTNLTWGIRPQPFTIDFTDGLNSCNSAIVTASGGVTYQWNGGDTPNQATNTFHTNGTYLVTVTNAGGCITSASKTVTVNTAPAVTFTGNTTACNSVTLTANGGNTYLWSGGTNPTSATNTFTASGTYTVVATTASGCSGPPVPVTVTINPPPVATITGNVPDCNSVTLTANGGVSYDWDGGLNPHSQINTFTASGTYIVTVTNANGCSSTASATVTILGPIPVIIGSTTGCTSVILTATGGLTYSWDGGLTYTANGTHTFTTSGDYTVLVKNSTSCVGTKTVHVVIALPVPVISGPASGCGSVTLTASGGVTYLWDSGDTPNSTTNTFHQSGTYTVIATNANGCSYPASATITVNNIPVITASDMVITNGIAVQAEPAVSGNIASYLWSPSTGLSDPTIRDPLVNPSATTAYTLTVTSVEGCTASSVINATVNRTDIIVPNTFTPNGDGTNDTWNIQYLQQYTNASVDIYNRYGKHLYHSIGYAKPWDGTFNGKPLPIGTYYYVIELNYNAIKDSGHVTIIR